MPRKSKKQRPSTTTTSTLATRRHWIYTDTNNNSSSQYDSYLHQRVQRVLVRSVPSNFSYFRGGEFEKITAFYVHIMYVWGGGSFLGDSLLSGLNLWYRMHHCEYYRVLLSVDFSWTWTQCLPYYLCQNQSLNFTNSFIVVSFLHPYKPAATSAAASGAIEEDKSADIVDESNEVRCKKNTARLLFICVNSFYTLNVHTFIITMFAIHSHPPNATLY